MRGTNVCLCYFALHPIVLWAVRYRLWSGFTHGEWGSENKHCHYVIHAAGICVNVNHSYRHKSPYFSSRIPSERGGTFKTVDERLN